VTKSIVRSRWKSQYAATAKVERIPTRIATAASPNETGGMHEIANEGNVAEPDPASGEELPLMLSSGERGAPGRRRGRPLPR
jgi:hypothetical protein